MKAAKMRTAANAAIDETKLEMLYSQIILKAELSASCGHLRTFPGVTCNWESALGAALLSKLNADGFTTEFRYNMDNARYLVVSWGE